MAVVSRQRAKGRCSRAALGSINGGVKTLGVSGVKGLSSACIRGNTSSNSSALARARKSACK